LLTTEQPIDLPEMRSVPLHQPHLSSSAELDDIGERALERASGAPVSEGNAVRLLLDARENYPAWLEEIRAAERTIFFEMYILASDAIGQEFAEALADRARAGVHVRVVYDWLGSRGLRRLVAMMRQAGAEVRVFNPPRLDSPLGWFARDHRKTITVDGRVGFVSGLCVSARWVGDPTRDLEPWRDTGIEIRGPAVADLERAFAQVWDVCGDELPEDALTPGAEMERVGPTRLRVIAGVPTASAMFRMDLVIASIARKMLWLTDAYFAATSAFVPALRAAARDGVDVRLLVPGASDIPALQPLSRAQYRPLLESGVRVFEWSGTMLHAKTAVADRRWARVGSTNLNLASWLTNYEMDVAIEDRDFAERMATQFEVDLRNATEIVLTDRNRVRPAAGEESGARTGEARQAARRSLSGSANRAAAGAVSVGSALGAALTNRRALGPAEAGLLFLVSVITISIGVIAAFWPRLLAWPLAFVCVWLGGAWAAKAIALKRRAQRAATEPPHATAGAGGRAGEDHGGLL
jgi:cardiolipin synthase